MFSPSRHTRGGGFNGVRKNPRDPSYEKQPSKEKNRPPPPAQTSPPRGSIRGVKKEISHDLYMNDMYWVMFLFLNDCYCHVISHVLRVSIQFFKSNLWT